MNETVCMSGMGQMWPEGWSASPKPGHTRPWAAFLLPPTVPLGISLPRAGNQGVSVNQFSQQPRDNTVGEAIEGIHNI